VAEEVMILFLGVSSCLVACVCTGPFRHARLLSDLHSELLDERVIGMSMRVAMP